MNTTATSNQELKRSTSRARGSLTPSAPSFAPAAGGRVGMQQPLMRSPEVYGQFANQAIAAGWAVQSGIATTGREGENRDGSIYLTLENKRSKIGTGLI